jgi:hypothetical protein
MSWAIVLGHHGEASIGGSRLLEMSCRHKMSVVIQPQAVEAEDENA